MAKMKRLSGKTLSRKKVGKSKPQVTRFVRQNKDTPSGKRIEDVYEGEVCAVFWSDGEVEYCMN
jgi:hypothetical protein